MVEVNSQQHYDDRAKSARQSKKEAMVERQSLSYGQTYVCPICRHGEISGIVLMDAFSCDFCRHIFTADLLDQTVRVEDSSFPISWRWNGYKWQAAHQNSQDLTITVWIVAVVLVLLPPSLVWLSAHIFPPMRGSGADWFPSVWVSLTFAAHFLFVAWVLLEHYQFPPYVSSKIRLRDLLGRR